MIDSKCGRNKSQKLSESDFALFLRACERTGLGRYDEALCDLDVLIKRNPKNFSILLRRAHVKQLMGRFLEALSDLDEAVIEAPEIPSVWRNRGEVRKSFGQYEEAIRDFDESIKLGMKDVFVWQQRGSINRLLCRYEEAIRDLGEAIKLDPKNAFALQELGEAKRMLGRHEEALCDLDKAIKLDSISEFAWKVRGSVKRLLGNYEGAISDLNMAMKLDPKNAFALKELGEANRMLARNEEATRDFEEAAKLKSNSGAVKQASEEVKVIQQQARVIEKQQVEKPLTTQEKIIKEKKTVEELRRRLEERLRGGEVKKEITEVPVVALNLSERPKQTSTDSSMQQGLDKTNIQMKPESKKINDLVVIPREKLKFMQEIGSGYFSIVYRGEWQFEESYGMPVAIKQLKKEMVLSEKVAQECRKEVEIHAKLNCPAIVKLLGVSREQPFCMVMELVELGSLRKFLDDQLDKSYNKRINWDMRLQIAQDLSTAVVYLHGQTPIIVHGDLKSLNVLLTRDYRAKVCDFGLAKLKVEVSSHYVHDNKEETNKPKGSLLWLAPELFSLTARRTTASDIFSLAIILWELASFSLPYESAGGNKDVIEGALKKGEREIFDDKRTPNTPKEYVALVKECWDGEPKKRPDAATVVVKLEAIYSKNSLAPTVFSLSPKAEAKTTRLAAASLITSLSPDLSSRRAHIGNIYK